MSVTPELLDKAKEAAKREHLRLDLEELRSGVAAMQKEIEELRAENEKLRAKLSGTHNEH